MRALITGASGFCAKHLAARFFDAEGTARIAGSDITDHSPKAAAIDDYFRADVSMTLDQMAASGQDALRQPEMLFHLAGHGVRIVGIRSTSASPRNTFLVNTMGAVNVLEAVRLHAPKCRILLVGSAAEYGTVPQLELPASEDRALPVRSERMVPPSSLRHCAAGRGIRANVRSKSRDGAAVQYHRTGNAGRFGSGRPGISSQGGAGWSDGCNRDSWRPLAGTGFRCRRRRRARVRPIAPGESLGRGVQHLLRSKPHSIQHVAEVLFSHSPRHITLQTD